MYICHSTFIDLNVISFMTSIIGVSKRLFLTQVFEQHQRGSTHKHAMSLINHGDSSDSEDMDEWVWRRMIIRDGDEYCTVQ